VTVDPPLRERVTDHGRAEKRKGHENLGFLRFPPVRLVPVDPDAVPLEPDPVGRILLSTSASRSRVLRFLATTSGSSDM
jgi:hypothetical protein